MTGGQTQAMLHRVTLAQRWSHERPTERNPLGPEGDNETMAGRVNKVSRALPPRTASKSPDNYRVARLAPARIQLMT